MADRISFPQLDDYYKEREKQRTQDLVDIFDVRNDIVAGAQQENRPLNPQEQDAVDALDRARDRLIDEGERDEQERNSGLTGEQLDELDKLEGTPEDMLTGEEIDHRDNLRNQVNNAPQDPVPDVDTDTDNDYMHGGPPDMAGGTNGSGGMAGGGDMSGGSGGSGSGGDTGGNDPEDGAMAGGGAMPGGGGETATRTPDMPAGPLEGGGLQPGRILYLPRVRIRGLSIGDLIRRRFGGAIDPGDSGPQITVSRGGGSLGRVRPGGGGVIVDPVPDSGVRTGVIPPEDVGSHRPGRDPTVTDPAEDSDDPRPR